MLITLAQILAGLGALTCAVLFATVIPLRYRPGRGIASQDLVNWLQELNEDSCAQMRETSPLWRTWRRLQDHRTLTGHWPPHAAINRN